MGEKRELRGGRRRGGREEDVKRGNRIERGEETCEEKRVSREGEI